MMQQRVYKVTEVAKLLQFHPFSIEAMCRNGKIHASKVGGRWFVTDENLRKFLGDDVYRALIDTPISIHEGR